MVKENELKRHVFKDTGRECLIRKVSPLTLAQIGRDFPPPKPPTQKVDYGDGDVRNEENPDHPDYKRTLGEYYMALEERIRAFMIKRGVEITLTDEDKEEVKRIRTEYEEDMGKPLSGSDKMIFISHICVGTQEDLEELLEAITNRSQPTPQEVDAVKDTFQG